MLTAKVQEGAGTGILPGPVQSCDSVCAACHSFKGALFPVSYKAREKSSEKFPGSCAPIGYASDVRQHALSLRLRSLRALGLPAAGVAGAAGIASLAACAAADRDVVMAPVAAPIVDAGTDAAFSDMEAGAEAGARHATRALREPANKPNCQRNVRCRAPDEDEQAVPFPEPFAHCGPVLAKDRRDVTFSPKETRTARTNEADVCCYVEFHSCTGRTIQIMEGRALRALGKVQRPTSGRRARPREQHARPRTRAPRLPSTEDEARALAVKWTRAAENEHASLATFARITLELLALGAPMDLVLACQRAGADEVRHAEDAYALASAFAGHEITAMPFAAACAPIVPDLLRLAKETLLDGCIGESAAALVATRDAEAAHDPSVKSALRRVARDESNHAELAFQLLAWAITAGGESVRQAIREELDAISHTTATNDDDALSLAVHSVTAPVVTVLTS